MIKRTFSVRAVGVVVLWVVGAASCGSEGHPVAVTTDVAAICDGYQNPKGNVRGDRPFEQNRDHLIARFGVLQSIAGLLDERGRSDLASSVRLIADGFQKAADAATNDELLNEVATVSADPVLVAAASELDPVMNTLCSAAETTG